MQKQKSADNEDVPISRFCIHAGGGSLQLHNLQLRFGSAARAALIAAKSE